MEEGKTKILIVEDEVIISMRLELFFQRRGYEVIGTLSSGEKAVELCRTNKPDVIIMDINLRGEMSGLDAGESICENSEIPIIFITGYSDEILKERAARLNPLGYFMKPINMFEIISALNKLDY
ncbi:MAG: response regulator [Candidatus Cloacimonetes bacterium]|nr:response regulator [Candidatus Cloacimonadota bacterium]